MICIWWGIKPMMLYNTAIWTGKWALLLPSLMPTAITRAYPGDTRVWESRHTHGTDSNVELHSCGAKLRLNAAINLMTETFDTAKVRISIHRTHTITPHRERHAGDDSTHTRTELRRESGTRNKHTCTNIYIYIQTCKHLSKLQISQTSFILYFYYQGLCL